ncbi:MAG: DUF502 domain-containing protein [Opitutales bacterium]|nr:DUF502 domain-containing protein [Opitutales bacterium]
MSIRSIRNAFISGLLLLAPVGVTVFVLNFLVNSLGGPSTKLFFFFVDRNLLDGYPLIEVVLNVLSAIIVCLLITLFGWFSKLLLGRFMLAMFERFMVSVPLVRTVYATVKQIIDTFASNKQAVFRKTVLVEYPRKGVFVLGFLTSDGRGEVQVKTSSEVLNIFVPTTPNPTSGFLLMVPREEVIMMDMSVADGMKVIISGGAVTPPYPAKERKPVAEGGAAELAPE